MRRVGLFRMKDEVRDISRVKIYLSTAREQERVLLYTLARGGWQAATARKPTCVRPE